MDDAKDEYFNPHFPSKAGLIQKIQANWKAYFPAKYRQLVKEGSLVAESTARAEMTLDYARDLERQGCSDLEAWDQAMREMALSA
jgi:hypothetical protein